MTTETTSNNSNLAAIKDEEILRKLWQDAQDFGKKKEIRAQMFKLREERLKTFYDEESKNSHISYNISEKKQQQQSDTQSHADALQDHSFMSLKSKEVRDSSSPTKDIRGDHVEIVLGDTSDKFSSTIHEITNDGKTVKHIESGSKSTTKLKDNDMHSTCSSTFKNTTTTLTSENGDRNDTKGALLTTNINENENNNSSVSSKTFRTSSSQSSSSSSAATVGVGVASNTSSGLLTDNNNYCHLKKPVENVTTESYTTPDGTKITTENIHYQDGTRVTKTRKEKTERKLTDSLSSTARKSSEMNTLHQTLDGSKIEKLVQSDTVNENIQKRDDNISQNKSSAIAVDLNVHKSNNENAQIYKVDDNTICGESSKARAAVPNSSLRNVSDTDVHITSITNRKTTNYENKESDTKIINSRISVESNNCTTPSHQYFASTLRSSSSDRNKNKNNSTKSSNSSSLRSSSSPERILSSHSREISPVKTIKTAANKEQEKSTHHFSTNVKQHRTTTADIKYRSRSASPAVTDTSDFEFFGISSLPPPPNDSSSSSVEKRGTISVNNVKKTNKIEERSYSSPISTNTIQKPILRRKDTYEERCKEILGISQKKQTEQSDSSFKKFNSNDITSTVVETKKKLTHESSPKANRRRPQMRSSSSEKECSPERRPSTEKKSPMNKRKSEIKDFQVQTKELSENELSDGSYAKFNQRTRTPLPSQIRRSPENERSPERQSKVELFPKRDKKSPVKIEEFPSQIRPSPEKERSLEKEPKNKSSSLVQDNNKTSKKKEFPSQIRSSPEYKYSSEKELKSDRSSPNKQQNDDKRPLLHKKPPINEFPCQTRRSVEKENYLEEEFKKKINLNKSNKKSGQKTSKKEIHLQIHRKSPEKDHSIKFDKSSPKSNNKSTLGQKVQIPTEKSFNIKIDDAINLSALGVKSDSEILTFQTKKSDDESLLKRTTKSKKSQPIYLNERTLQKQQPLPINSEPKSKHKTVKKDEPIGSPYRKQSEKETSSHIIKNKENELIKASVDKMDYKNIKPVVEPKAVKKFVSLLYEAEENDRKSLKKSLTKNKTINELETEIISEKRKPQVAKVKPTNRVFNIRKDTQVKVTNIKKGANKKETTDSGGKTIEKVTKIVSIPPYSVKTKSTTTTMTVKRPEKITRHVVTAILPVPPLGKKTITTREDLDILDSNNTINKNNKPKTKSYTNNCITTKSVTVNADLDDEKEVVIKLQRSKSSREPTPDRPSAFPCDEDDGLIPRYPDQISEPDDSKCKLETVNLSEIVIHESAEDEHEDEDKTNVNKYDDKDECLLSVNEKVNKFVNEAQKLISPEALLKTETSTNVVTIRKVVELKKDRSPTPERLTIITNIDTPKSKRKSTETIRKAKQVFENIGVTNSNVNKTSYYDQNQNRSSDFMKPIRCVRHLSPTGTSEKIVNIHKKTTLNQDDGNSTNIKIAVGRFSEENQKTKATTTTTETIGAVDQNVRDIDDIELLETLLEQTTDDDLRNKIRTHIKRDGFKNKENATKTNVSVTEFEKLSNNNDYEETSTKQQPKGLKQGNELIKSQKFTPYHKTNTQETSKSSKFTRKGSVKEISKKFIDNAIESCKNEKKYSYPKAGLILRSSHRQTSFNDSKNNEEKSTITTTTAENSSNTFLTNTTKVTGVHDIINRIKNAENDALDRNEDEDAQARMLLNKFLGCQVLLTGIESSLTSSESRITTIKKTINKGGKTIFVELSFRHPISEKDLYDIWDVDVLQLLLEKCRHFEEQQVVKARLDLVMAEQEARGDVLKTPREEVVSNVSIHGESLLPLLQGLLNVPETEQTADSGTESGEDLRGGLLNEVQCALAKLSSSLKTDSTGMTPEKRNTLLQLVTKLQAGLTSQNCNQQQQQQQQPSNERRASSGSSRFVRRRQRQNRHTVGVSSEELEDARRLMEEIAFREGMSGDIAPNQFQTSISKQSSEGSVKKSDYQPVILSANKVSIKNAVAKPYSSSNTSLSQSGGSINQSGASSTAQTPSERTDSPDFNDKLIKPNNNNDTTTTAAAIRKTNSNNESMDEGQSDSASEEEEEDDDEEAVSTTSPSKTLKKQISINAQPETNESPLPKILPLSEEQFYETKASVVLKSSPTIYGQNNDVTDKKSYNRFNSKKSKMKRANTIDIPKPLVFYDDDDSDDEYERSPKESNGTTITGVGLRGPVQVGEKINPNKTLPTFKPKTENDRKFVAFISKFNNNGVKTSTTTSWSNRPPPETSGRNHWGSKFGNLKKAFEVASAPTNFWKSADDTLTAGKVSYSGPTISRQSARNLQRMFEEKSKLNENNQSTNVFEQNHNLITDNNIKSVPKPAPINKFSHAPTSAFMPIPKRTTTTTTTETKPSKPNTLDLHGKIVKTDLKNDDPTSPLYLYSPKTPTFKETKTLFSPTTTTTNPHITTPPISNTTPWSKTNDFGEHRVHKLALSKFEKQNNTVDLHLRPKIESEKVTIPTTFQKQNRSETTETQYLSKSSDKRNAVRKLSDQFDNMATKLINDNNNNQQSQYTPPTKMEKKFPSHSQPHHFQPVFHDFNKPLTSVSVVQSHANQRTKGNVSNLQQNFLPKIQTSYVPYNSNHEIQSVQKKKNEPPTTDHQQHLPPQYTSFQEVALKRSSPLESVDKKIEHKPNPQYEARTSLQTVMYSKPNYEKQLSRDAATTKPKYHKQKSNESIKEYQAAETRVMKGPVSHQAVTVHNGPKTRNEHDLDTAFNIKMSLNKFSKQNETGKVKQLENATTKRISANVQSHKNNEMCYPKKANAPNTKTIAETKEPVNKSSVRKMVEQNNQTKRYNDQQVQRASSLKISPVDSKQSSVGQKTVPNFLVNDFPVGVDALEEKSRKSTISKMEAWQKIVQENQSQGKPVVKSILKSKSSNTLAVPNLQFQAGMTKDELVHKKRTIEAYFTGTKSPQSLSRSSSDDGLDKREGGLSSPSVPPKTTINRKKTSEKVSSQSQSVTSVSGVVRSRTLPNIVCPRLLDETNIDEAFEDLFRSTS